MTLEEFRFANCSLFPETIHGGSVGLVTGALIGLPTALFYK